MIRVLLTGDDGYRSSGIRLAAAVLKDHYDLTIAATMRQCSGASGKLSVNGGEWGEDRIEDLPVLWVSGTPVDAVECARTRFSEGFDLVVSGLNFGANVGTGVSSGTIGAALRALTSGMVRHAIAFSWDLPPANWFETETGGDICKLKDYPGTLLSRILAVAVENEFWRADLINVNFPMLPATKAVFTRPERRETAHNRVELFSDHTYRYHFSAVDWPDNGDNCYDATALKRNLISIAPICCYADHSAMLGLAGKSFEF